MVGDSEHNLAGQRGWRIIIEEVVMPLLTDAGQWVRKSRIQWQRWGLIPSLKIKFFGPGVWIWSELLEEVVEARTITTFKSLHGYRKDFRGGFKQGHMGLA